jgi:hypothetical protein
MALHTKFVFSGASVQQLYDDLTKYRAAGETYVRVKLGEHECMLQVCGENGDGGGDIDQSVGCPGAPGCP